MPSMPNLSLGQDQYIAIFTKTIINTVTIQGKKRFKLPIETITFRKHSFQIDTRWLTYRNKNKFVYFIDVDKGQMSFQKFKEQVENPKLMDKVLNGHIISDLVSGLASVGTIPWTWGIVFIAVGLPIGIILGWIFPI